MDHKSTNSKTRTNQIIQNQNTPYYFPREIPQHPRQPLRSPLHLYRCVQTGNKSWLCYYFPEPRIAKASPK